MKDTEKEIAEALENRKETVKQDFLTEIEITKIREKLQKDFEIWLEQKKMISLIKNKSYREYYKIHRQYLKECTGIKSNELQKEVQNILNEPILVNKNNLIINLAGTRNKYFRIFNYLNWQDKKDLETKHLEAFFFDLYKQTDNEIIDLLNHFRSLPIKHIPEYFLKHDPKQAIEATAPEITAKDLLKIEYPIFAKELPILLEHGFLIEKEKNYTWKKSKRALAYYIKGLAKQKEKNTRWDLAENAFNETGLKSNSTGTYYNKNPKDYEILLELLPR